MSAQVFQVDEDVVGIRVAIRISLRCRQQQILRYELDRLVGVCEGESCVVDDFLLTRKPNLLRRFVRHLCSRVTPAHRVRSKRPSIRQRFSLPYLFTRVMGQGSVKIRRENVVPAGGVPQLPGDRVKTWTCAPCELRRRELVRRLQQPFVRELVEPQKRLPEGTRLRGHPALKVRRSLVTHLCASRADVTPGAETKPARPASSLTMGVQPPR